VATFGSGLLSFDAEGLGLGFGDVGDMMVSFLFE